MIVLIFQGFRFFFSSPIRAWATFIVRLMLSLKNWREREKITDLSEIKMSNDWHNMNVFHTWIQDTRKHWRLTKYNILHYIELIFFGFSMVAIIVFDKIECLLLIKWSPCTWNNLIKSQSFNSSVTLNVCFCYF